MCGILGIWRPSGISEEEVQQGLDKMSVRGPDACSAALLDDKKIALGHLRLAIQDLSDAANQPMTSADNRWTIVYNGEVVNFREIKRSMPSRSWRTDCDTEVILESISANGIGCLDGMVGMFAAVVYDAHEKVLYLLRDRFGIKPLYYTFLPNGGFAAASEIPPLLSVRRARNQADEDVLLTYLETGLYETGEKTFFKDILSLPAGHWAKFCLKTGKFNKECWYDFPEKVNSKRQGARKNAWDTQSEMAFLIDQAIRDHLVSDVPVGLNVSGGVDSSVLCNIAQKYLPDLHVFTQDYPQPYSELDWVKQVAGKARLHAVHLSSASIRSKLTDTIRRQAEPFGGVSVIGYDALYRKAVSEKVTVLLDGNGVDECFLGYSKYQSALNGALTTTTPTSIDGTHPTHPNAISAQLRKRASLIQTPHFSGHFDHPVRDMAAQDLLCSKIPRGLRFNDRMSMGCSRELRVPFLDHRLVEFAYNMPIEMLLDGTHTKACFRNFARQHIGSVALEQKRSVQSPQREWLADSWSDIVLSIISSDRFAARGWVNPETASKAYENYRKGYKSNSFYIWQWINLELWAREYLD